MVSEWWIGTNLEISGRGLILRYYPAVAWKDWVKPRKVSQDSSYSGRDFNPGPPEYEAGVLTATFVTVAPKYLNGRDSFGGNVIYSTQEGCVPVLCSPEQRCTLAVQRLWSLQHRTDTSGQGRANNSVLQEDEDGWEDRQAALDLLLKWEVGGGGAGPTQRTGISELMCIRAER
jgi:hypothetical protein